MGYKVVIFTARPWSDLYLIKYLVKEYDLPVDQIICGKPLFHLLIDDRNVSFKGDWKDAVDQVK